MNPLVVVYNIPKPWFDDEKQITALKSAITGAFLSIPEMGLKKENISFSFLMNPTVMSNDTPIYIIVELLFDMKKRTELVRQKFAEEIWYSVFNLTYRTLGKVNAGLLRVAIKRFNPTENGFYPRPKKD